LHEYGITKNALETVLQQTEEKGAGRITEIHFVLGGHSDVEPDSVRLYFDEISAGTPAEGAALHFRRLPASYRCWDCSKTFETSLEEARCLACGSVRIHPLAGDEFYAESVEVE